jgi:hypothetical protein
MSRHASQGRRQRSIGVRTTVILAAVLALAAALVGVAPEERTLGAGIKSVYVHVALTLAGVTGLILAGALGLFGLFSSRGRLHAWMLAIGRVGLLFFAAGVAVSLWAARINWGGVTLEEPLLRASLILLGVAWIAQLTMLLFRHARWHAALSLLPASGLAALVFRAPRVMHPPAAVLPSAPEHILLTFVGLTVLFLVAGAQLSWHLSRR